MRNITFVNKANFVKLYNNFVLKWLIFALYVVVVPEQILLGTWAYRKVKIRGAETNLPDFPDFARQVPKKFSGEKLF
jgi:hypothetical protein